MPEVRPFRGLLFDTSVAPLDAFTAPPYDVISPMDQDRLYATSPYNVVRLILGKEETGDGDSENKYRRAGAYLRTWRDRGILRQTAHPAVYPYELSFHWRGEERRIRGVVAEVDLEPWNGSIVPHERTMAGPIQDRLSLIRAVHANLSPVYGVLPSAAPQLAAYLDDVTAGPPDRETSDEAGTTHRLWVSQDAGPIQAAARSRPLMIADGHHRYTVALAYREEMRAAHGPGPWDSLMVFIVDAGTEHPPVLPIHRVAADGDVTAGDLPGSIRVRDMAEILVSIRDEDMTFGLVRIERGDVIHRVARAGGSPPTVCALHEEILDRVRSDRMRFVPDAVAAEHAVVSGSAAAAYLLPPTTVERVWAVVQGQRRLPQKSTYFWPKPRTGMVIRPLEP